MTSKIKHIAVYGGTFCPIQNAHIRLAQFLQEKFKFDQFRFLPNKEPVLEKSAALSLEHRLAMLAIALKPYKDFMIDTREVLRDTPSFMIDTLKDLRQELGDRSSVISLVIGMDNFNEFHRWRDWENIPRLCNLIVIDRLSYELKTTPEVLHKLHEIITPSGLVTGETGGFYRCNAGLYDISSTMIRNFIKEGRDVGAYVPRVVLDYIEKNKLFKS